MVLGLSKDAYYFPHDSNARHDLKIKALRKVYGWQGYGWYWLIVETLREEQDFKLEYGDFTFDALADDMGCPSEDTKKFIDDCINRFKLFTADGEHFYSKSLIERMERLEKAREQRREAGKRSAEKRQKGNEEPTTVERPLNEKPLDVQQGSKGSIDSKEEESNPPAAPLKYPNNLINELTEKLMSEWLEACPQKPLKDDIQKTRAKVFESLTNGTKADVVRFALDKLKLGKPLGAWSAYLQEYGSKQEQHTKQSQEDSDYEYEIEMRTLQSDLLVYQNNPEAVRQINERIAELKGSRV